jgi:hypothetical protein
MNPSAEAWLAVCESLDRPPRMRSSARPLARTTKKRTLEGRHAMKRMLVITAAVLAWTTVARAEDAEHRFDVAPFVGAYVPTGDQRDLLDDGFSVGLTASYELHRYLAVVGSFSWARPR